LTQVRDTSLEAYYSIERLGEKQRRVLAYIKAFPGSTDRELAQMMNCADPNGVRPRRKELVDLGLVVECGARVCRVSGRRALTWRAR